MLIDVPPILAYVRSEYLYSLKEGFGYFSPATIFAISSVNDKELTFEILVDDKTLFSNISVCAIANSKTAPKANYECIYHNCPDENASIVRHEYLLDIERCGIWNKDNSFWQQGNYIFTIEWPRVKQQLQFIELDDGNYIFWENSKITWGEKVPKNLPEF